MSKLIDKLERIARGSPVPMGFGALAKTDKVAALLMIGVVKPDKRKHPSVESVDAVLFEGAKDAAALGEAGKKLTDVPWGAVLTDGGVASTEAARTAGADFIIVHAAGTPVSALDGEQTTYLLTVTADLPDRQLRALEGLPVEGFVLRQAQLHQPITIEDLMTVSAVRSMTGKYLFVEASPELSAKELEALRDMDIAGILVDLSETTAEALGKLRERLLGLPKPKDGKKGMSAVLPQQGNMSFGRRRQHDDPDEEEEYEEDDE